MQPADCGRQRCCKKDFNFERWVCTPLLVVSPRTLTKFEEENNCNGSPRIIKMQLQGSCCPPEGNVTAKIIGEATVKLGGHSVLVNVVPVDRSLQEGTSQPGSFSVSVETAAFDDASSAELLQQSLVDLLPLV